ncbi:MAG: type II secretion system GspH family protein [Bdellovibrionales bacterium]|nr:type II secretion system GspH family protein [Bdellovibrionales bacterium]
MKRLTQTNQKGFTLIELLMVILVIAILAVIGVTQFVNYGKDSRDAATRANLQVLRRAISEKNGLMRLRCNVQTVSFPDAASINANDINGGASGCLPSQVTVPDSVFVAGGIPVNPWSNDIQANEALSRTVTACVGDATSGCTAFGNHCARNCAGVAHTGAENGWCYNQATGEIWANTRRNSGSNGAPSNECDY